MIYIRLETGLSHTAASYGSMCEELFTPPSKHYALPFIILYGA
jgi:hypothetical protein